MSPVVPATGRGIGAAAKRDIWPEHLILVGDDDHLIVGLRGERRPDARLLARRNGADIVAPAA